MRFLKAAALVAVLMLVPIGGIALSAVAMDSAVAQEVAAPAKSTDVATVATPAADVVVTVQAAPDTSISVPLGNWAADALTFIGSVILAVMGGVLTWVLTLIPSTLRAYIKDQQIKQVEQLLARAVEYGINAVSGAVKGQHLDVDIGSAVVAQAAQYAIDHGPEKLIAWLGGPDRIKEMVLARIPLEQAAAADEVLAKSPPVAVPA